MSLMTEEEITLIEHTKTLLNGMTAVIKKGKKLGIDVTFQAYMDGTVDALLKRTTVGFDMTIIPDEPTKGSPPPWPKGRDQ